MNLPFSDCQSWHLRQWPSPESIAAWSAAGSSASLSSFAYLARHLALATLRGQSDGYASQNSAKRRSWFPASPSRVRAHVRERELSFGSFPLRGVWGGFFLFPFSVAFFREPVYRRGETAQRRREFMDCFICHFAPLLRPLPLHGAGLATGATARPTRTSRTPPDVILTLVHSTRLLPWGVKIMSVPRSVSRVTVAPYAPL